MHAYVWWLSGCCKGVCTFDCRTLRVLWVLQASHGKRGLYPDVGVFIRDTDQHGLVDPIAEPVVDLRILAQAAQQLVHQLTHPEPHRVAAHAMTLRHVKKTKTEAETYLLQFTIFISEFGSRSELLLYAPL